ncbi:MAG: lysophospholipid acyltransferase family protein [Propionibacteriaceae bacterium]
MADRRLTTTSQRESDVSSRYASPAHSGARTAAQRLLLKPYLNSLVDITVHGKEHLKGLKTPFIVTANHSSHLDANLIFTTLPISLSRNLATGAAADFFFNQWWKAAPMALFFNAFPVERAGKTKTPGGSQRGMAGRLLSKGVPLLIFAEGTRTRTGAMGQFNPGTAALSISRSVPILPVALVGAYAAWPSHARRCLPGKPPVHVVYGPPMTAAPGEIASEFAERVREVIGQMHDQTARAYHMPTHDDFARMAALKELPPGSNFSGSTIHN